MNETQVEEILKSLKAGQKAIKRITRRINALACQTTRTEAWKTKNKSLFQDEAEDFEWKLEKAITAKRRIEADILGET